MRFLFWISILFYTFAIFPTPVGAQEITVLTTTWIPFSYEESGELTGLSTEVVKAVLKRAEISADIKLYPWQRAIFTARTGKNILVYPLMRIPEREKDFIWVAPLFNARIALFKLKNRKDIRIESLDEAKKYTIGVLRGAAMHQHLLAHGFEDKTQLQVFNSNSRSVELLFRDRVDLIADNPLVISYEAKKLGFSMHSVEEVYPLFEDPAYMAFGKKSDEKYAEILQRTHEELQSDGALDSIFKKYQ